MKEDILTCITSYKPTPRDMEGVPNSVKIYIKALENVFVRYISECCKVDE